MKIEISAKFIILITAIFPILTHASASTAMRGTEFIIGQVTYAPACEGRTRKQGEKLATIDAKDGCHPKKARRISDWTVVDHAMGCDWQTLLAVFGCE